MKVKNYSTEFLNVLHIAFEDYVANYADYPGGIYVHPQFLRESVDINNKEQPLNYCGVMIVEDDTIPFGEIKLI